LPAAANSGQCRPTGASRSRTPRSARTSAHSASIVLLTDQTLTTVSRCHGTARAASAYPPQRSATGSPSTKTAADAPTSRSLSDSASASRTAWNRLSQLPLTSDTSRTQPHAEVNRQPVNAAPSSQPAGRRGVVPVAR